MKRYSIVYIILSIIFLSFSDIFAQKSENPNWGFSDFSATTVYNVDKLTQEAIQSAIDKASKNGGGTVIIPSGTIELTTWLVLKDNVKLKGALNSKGEHLTVLSAKKDAFADEKIYSIIKLPNVTNVTIEDLIIDGNQNFASGITVSSRFGASKNILVSNNIIKNIGVTKCETKKETKDWATYKKSPTAINFWSNTNPASCFTIKNNEVYNIAKHGIDVNLGVKYLIINNHVTNAYMGMDASSGSDEGEITGNTFIDCLYGLKIVNAHNINFHDNKVYNLDDTPWWDEWIGGWNDGTGVALVLQEAGGKKLKNIIIKNNILSSVKDKPQWVFWDVENPDDKITFTTNSNHL
jgi:hypothetical protein